MQPWVVSTVFTASRDDRMCQRCFPPAARPVGVMDHGARCIHSRATHTQPLHINPSFSRRAHHARTPHLSTRATVSFIRQQKWRLLQQPHAFRAPHDGRAGACTPPLHPRSRNIEMVELDCSFRSCDRCRRLVVWSRDARARARMALQVDRCL